MLYGTTHIASAYGGASVNVFSNGFDPSTVTVQVGDTVTWTNTQGFHNVRADDGSFGNEPAGGAWTLPITFDTAGTYEYYCEIHSSPDGTSMNGVVIVEEGPTAVSLSTLGAIADTNELVLVAGLGLLLTAGVVVAFRRQQA
jgi:plastocyanin